MIRLLDQLGCFLRGEHDDVRTLSGTIVGVRCTRCLREASIDFANPVAGIPLTAPIYNPPLAVQRAEIAAKYTDPRREAEARTASATVSPYVWGV